jgi:hypothetical protein
MTHLYFASSITQFDYQSLNDGGLACSIGTENSYLQIDALSDRRTAPVVRSFAWSYVPLLFAS